MVNENLGPAERIIQQLLAYTDHGWHGRTGQIFSDPTSVCGVSWAPVTWKAENGEKIVYSLTKTGKKTNRVKLGILQANNKILGPNGQVVGEFRPSGIFPELITWMYRSISEIWKLDNEFVARWASYAFGQEHRDLKVVLAAFLLCQSRKGDPVLDAGKVAFHDEDFRDVGEAMLLLQRNSSKDMNAKQLLRVQEVLQVPGVAEINRELGFGKSARKPFTGRYSKAVEKWLAYREENPRLLEGLVKAGFRTTVMSLSRSVGYKPSTPKFFEALRWKQKQSEAGHRQLAIGQEVAAAESWAGLSEKEICERIVSQKVGFKRLVGLLPKEVGLTRAVVAAAVEAGSLSDKDLVILTPTLEELGLLQVPEIQGRWQAAVKNAEDQRAANIALRVKSKETQEALQGGADKAAQKAVEEVTRNMMVYVLVDISGSMAHSIEAAKEYVAKFVQAFPLNKIKVATFNTIGREVIDKHASKAGVEAAFRGICASGGTNHRGSIDVLAKYKPQADEDVLFVWVGDEGQYGSCHDAVIASGLNPMAFGLIKVSGENGSFVRDTAARLQIPCFMIDNKTFDDPYSIPRTIRNIISATPVGHTATGATKRVGIVETILQTSLLQKPNWA